MTEGAQKRGEGKAQKRGEGKAQGTSAEIVPLDHALALKRIADLSKLDALALARQLPAVAAEIGIGVSALRGIVRGTQRAAERELGRDAGQGRAVDLTEIQRWDAPVDGAALLTDVASAIRRHVIVSDPARDATALWVVAVHAFDSFSIFPRLFVTAPTKGAGKTTLLDVLERLVPRPLAISSATAAALYRVIAAKRPVLLLDEADAWMGRDNEDVRAVINSGHKAGGKVLRCVGDEAEPREFDVFSPVALAAIGRLPDTIEARSVIVSMRRKRHDEAVELLRAGRGASIDELASKIARFAHDNIDALAQADPPMPPGIGNRAADNWVPLLAVADAAGGIWPERARLAATACAVGEDQSRVIMLLSDIRKIFIDSGAERFTSEQLAARLAELDDRPWPDWKNGKPITKQQVSRLLGGLEIKSGTIRSGAPRTGDEPTAKGYYLASFSDAFERYLPVPPSENVTSSQPAFDGGFSALSKRHNGAVTDACDVSGGDRKPNGHGLCDDVTFSDAPLAGEDGQWTE